MYEDAVFECLQALQLPMLPISSALGKCWDGSPAITEEFRSRDKRILTLQKETALDNFNAAMIGYYSRYVWLLGRDKANSSSGSVAGREVAGQ